MRPFSHGNCLLQIGADSVRRLVFWGPVKGDGAGEAGGAFCDGTMGVPMSLMHVDALRGVFTHPLGLPSPESPLHISLTPQKVPPAPLRLYPAKPSIVHVN